MDTVPEDCESGEPKAHKKHMMNNEDDGNEETNNGSVNGPVG